jgi:DNA-binding transcriptional ArsR family regulator
MSTDSSIPDYDLDEQLVITAPTQLRAIANPLRNTILDLLLERAATVAELAAAVARPRGTVAYHVNVLVDAGLLRTVRTRRVRAVEERYYGRTARMFPVGVVERPGEGPTTLHDSALFEAAAEAAPAHEADTAFMILRHARIPRERAVAFWQGVLALSRDFAEIPRSGDTVFGFAAGLYPTDFPTLPDPDDEQERS